MVSSNTIWTIDLKQAFESFNIPPKEYVYDMLEDLRISVSVLHDLGSYLISDLWKDLS